jgi:hypothetical protein
MLEFDRFCTEAYEKQNIHQIYPMFVKNPGKSSILSIFFIFISTPLSFFFLFGVYKLRLYAYDKILRYFNNNRNFQEKDEEIFDPMKLENGTHV